MRSRLLAIALIAAMITVAIPTSQAGQYDLKTSIGQNEARALVDGALANPQVKGAADDKVSKEGPVTLAVDITGAGRFTFTYDGALKNGGGKPAYTVSGSKDTALAIVNSDDKGRMLACFVSSGLISISAAKSTEQAAINAARSQASSGVDCSFGVGSKVTFRGLQGTAEAHKNGLFKADVKEDLDYLVLNKFGAPVGWLAKEAARLSGGASTEAGGDGMTKVSKQDIAACKAAIVAQFAAQFQSLQEKQDSDPWGSGADVQKLIDELKVAQSEALGSCEYLGTGEA